MEHHYTESLGHDDIKFYPLLQSTIDLWNTHYTEYVSHIEECTYTWGRHTYPPPPIDHRSMEHHYTESLGHDDTPNLWVMMTLSFTSPIDHRSMEHHYTK